jgi:hypothetical protein
LQSTVQTFARETSLVVFYLCIRAEKKENPIFKIGIIQLDLDSIPEIEPVRVSLYDQKSIPFEKKTTAGKTPRRQRRNQNQAVAQAR